MSNISEKEFLEQLEKHQNIVHKVCHMFAPGEADRRDLFQEITIKLWLGFQSFKGDAALTTWMYRVALNTAITLKRKDKKKQDIQPLHPNLKEPEEDDEAITKQDIEMLYQAINKLEPVDKAIILLYLEEKKYDEIAEIMGLTRSNVGVKITRIKKKLETILEPMNQ